MKASAQSLGSRYRLDTIIGSGAMGQVWRAEDIQTGEAVAAKILRPEFAADAAIVGRFIQERSILLSLDHPRIVRIRDLVVEGDQLALIMDLVEGSDLRSLLRQEETIDPQTAVRLTVDVLEALAAAHEKGILHRDVKPDNVLLDPSETPPAAMLTDFSIARLAQQTTVRMTGVLGTAEYIAPEVFQSEDAGRPVDVYGAGIMLYELLTGRTPFAGGESDYAIAHRHVTTAPPPVAGIPASLAAVLSSMLAKVPVDRPTALGAADDLRRVLPSLSGLSRLSPIGAPSQWDLVVPAAEAISVRGAPSGPEAVVDPKSTNIKGNLAAPPREHSGPVAGDGVALLSPDGQRSGSDGATTLHVAPSRPRDRAVDTIAPITTPERSQRNRLKVVLIGVAAAVVLIVAVVVLTGSGGKSPHTKATSANGASGPPSFAEPSVTLGITSITRSASYSEGQVTVTLQYAVPSGGVPLVGPFYESLDFDHSLGGCPQAPNTNGVAGVKVQQETAIGTCGLEITTGTIEPGGAAARATVSFPIPAQKSMALALQELLSQEAQSTETALEGITDTPQQYPDQRLSGLVVDVTPPTALNQPLAVQVYPQWVSSNGNAQDLSSILYDSTQPTPFTSVFQLVTTQDSLLTLHPSSDCYNALTLTSAGTYVVQQSNAAAASCTIGASLGSVSTGTSSSFDLSQI